MNMFSCFFALLGFVPYIWAILKGQTAPSPVSWAIWLSVDILALLAMKKEKSSSTGQLTGCIFGAFIVTVLSMIFGKPAMGYVELISIAGAVTGVILWKTTGSAITAIVCTQLAIFAGAIPTFMGAYEDPSKEDPIAWSIWTLSCVFALLAIKKWNFADALQPLNFTVIEVTMLILIFVKPLF